MVLKGVVIDCAVWLLPLLVVPVPAARERLGLIACREPFLGLVS